MSRFSIRNPYLIIVICLMVVIVGITCLVRMPVDLFPAINLPEVVVATSYNGMPPEEIETEITGKFERFFTLSSGIDHMESRSLPGVSVIKVFFQPGTDADSDVNSISNLAMADLRRLPPGTLPPIILKFDASSLPVCLITLKGEGLSEAALRDIGQYSVRNQLAVVPGASIPQPFGGKYRQIMVYVDPAKLQAYQLSPMDVVRAVNNANLILPAGDVKIGALDYALYTNSQFSAVDDINAAPIKTVGMSTVTVGDLGWAEDGHQIQTNIVRVNGQPSVYLPIMKQGGDSNTIAVVDGVKRTLTHLTNVPKELVPTVVFDQSLFVKRAIETLLDEGSTGLILTGLMVLMFLASFRATVAVFLSIPLSALAAFIALYFGGSSINTMILAGFALVFSRLIDNAVVVLENIFRHLEMGEAPAVAAEQGAQEVALAVLASTLTSSIVFFPVLFLYGVSRFIFSALALAVVLALFASYFVALSVVPLFCANLIKASHHDHAPEGDAHDGRSKAVTWGQRFSRAFNAKFTGLLNSYERRVRSSLKRPGLVVAGIMAVFLASLALYPFLGVAFFPRTDAGQFVINVKSPSGSRIEVSSENVAQVEALVRRIVEPQDLELITSNIGVTPDISAIYTSNAGPHTATVQVALTERHHIGSYEYMDRVRRAMASELPQLSAYFQSGGMVDAVLNQGLPAPIDVQVSAANLGAAYAKASELATKIRALPRVSDVYIPQDLDYPSLQLNINRERANELGLDQREVVSNVITALTSNGMIAPSYWVDPRSGNDYMLTVQYPEGQIHNLLDLSNIPLHARAARASVQARQAAAARQTVRGQQTATAAARQVAEIQGAGVVRQATTLDAVSRIRPFKTPTEVDHYQIQRVIDIYVNPATEDLGAVASGVQRILDAEPAGIVRVTLRGMVEGMNQSFRSFGFGLILALVLLYLILVAQFKSFADPILILLAVPTGVTGVLVALYITGTTLNVQSLMGVLMMVGMVVSNSILIVEFTHRLEADGTPTFEAVVSACRIRLRPILMTSFATIIGLLPMALKLGVGSEAYAPLARAIIGGLLVSVVLTVFIVPAAYLVIYRGRLLVSRAETK